ncbi:Gfo/Idh/MocA family protein [Tuwongella immobilis]|uniref:Gfo/Idh/MocA-like oxidoreductase N-terminal domain-containing protein n=1 Tax=Tuwongella immobilis TaxID=692036 RepID=A0A6C2YU33_9BACT|nr:Gfo/Idh/MocA family oxidoreductase [Tuwongella immobilis]VIP04549.1 3-chlorobenzoate- -dioxygenase dehydrogenase : Oxidoreductase domain protein OS=Pirellula staleyi (strain ATCC 27377 / DSM 6068 / ICPB 4128) GN=Psta_2300 PE=4 SV=1: GFO_IDH_MocA [Tuwongella immobilis]VTS06459.1 3-chlorobenzoate- -dioxygenase dehydrogenase : Oxidoreductase domain protein OS=Pirellula staleyi (strain ATCC 27377 / DSM 6068 / ICPB 4128) GN=Psta_2300 PE=4 SV=1: GFO_IDH_MocA [Tuwongella immobilis]
MSASKQFTVAVIGRTGKGNYGHGLDTVWLNQPRAKLIAVADENEAGRAAALKRLNLTKGYADYREMLATEKPQIVSVADRWLDCHAPMVKACADAGASIFLEKPVARSLVEADAMVKACDVAHVKCAIAHQTRYNPAVDHAKRFLADGGIGEIVEIRARGKEDHRGGGQDLMVLGTHLFDLMRYLVGDPRWCHAQIWQDDRIATKADIRMGGEQMGPVLGNRIIAQYGFARGIIGHFGTQIATDNRGKRFGMMIYGTKGMMHFFEVGGLSPVRYCLDPSWSGEKAPWQPISSQGVDKPEVIQGESSLPFGNRIIVNDLMDAIEQDRAPRGSLADGRAALEMILAVYESHRVGKPVDLPLKNRQHPLEIS